MQEGKGGGVQGLTGQIGKQELNQEKAALRWDGTGLFLSFFPSLSLPPPPFPLSLYSFPLSLSDGLHVVSRQHALLAGALHPAVHPAFIDLLHVYDHVPIQKGDLVLISSRVVIHGPVPLLWTQRKSVTNGEFTPENSCHSEKESLVQMTRRTSGSLRFWVFV